MNATEDGVEPMGEAPDVPARYDAGMTSVLEAIDRGSVIGVLSAADAVLATRQLAERQTQALKTVRAIHERGIFTATGKFYCKHCRAREVEWPCRTIRAIDEVGA